MTKRVMLVVFLVFFSATVFGQEPSESPVLTEVEALQLQLHLARVRIAELSAQLADVTARLDSVTLTQERQAVTPARAGFVFDWTPTATGALTGFVPVPVEAEEP